MMEDRGWRMDDREFTIWGYRGTIENRGFRRMRKQDWLEEQCWIRNARH